MELKNSQIRRIVLGEHQGLRKRLDEIEAGLKTLTDAHPEPLAQVRVLFKALLEAFVRHVEHEEALLKPILLDLDAWGPVRLEEMEKEHKEQREHVAALLAIDPLAPVATWVTEMRGFTDRLRADMDGEERDFLDPNVLRDDVITVDTFSG